MTTETTPGFKTILSSRDAATAETRAKAEENVLRYLNSYVQSFAVRDPKYFVTLPANYIEYLCQLAYEGKPVEGAVQRSTTLAQRIGASNLEKLKTTGKGLITMLTSSQSTKAEPSVRKTMLRELLLFHNTRMKRKEYPHAPVSAFRGVRRRANAYLDEDYFCLIIPRKQIKGLAWDEETQTSRFRCSFFTDIVKVEGINLTQGHNWKHLRLQTKKTWHSEIVEWQIVPKSTRCFYIREERR